MSASASHYHILTKAGDAAAEIERMVAELGSPDAAGLHRHFFVTRANQTVVMTAGRDAPLARKLRGTKGWQEPAKAKEF